jgi:hypothetical protein
MREIKIPTVTINGEEYPIYCDLYVLSQIQDRMDINDFERGILGAEIVRDEDGNPIHREDGRIEVVFGKYDIKAMIMGLTLMINEGLLIDSEQKGTKYEPVDETYIGRICDMPLVQLSNTVHETFGRCLESKKNETEKKPTSRKRNTSK